MKSQFWGLSLFLFASVTFASDSIDWGKCYPDLQTYCNEKTDDASKHACLKSLDSQNMSTSCLEKIKELEPKPKRKFHRRYRPKKKPA
jgi:hypothetical protein